MATLVRKIMGAGIPAGTASTLLGDVQNSLTATGTSQSDAQNIGSAIARFTTVASGTGAILPAGAIGDELLVVNAGANALSLYPPVGHAINAGSTNAAISVAPSSSLIVKRILNLLWIAQDASQLFFLQAGTGAVSRTMQTKVRELGISVKDFGATGDGTTNDRTDVSEGVTEANGRLLFFPRGTYNIGSALAFAETDRLYFEQGATFSGTQPTGGLREYELARSAAVAGSKMKIERLVESSSFPLEDIGSIWSGATQTFSGVSKEFTSIDGAADNPCSAFFVEANNNNSPADVVAIQAVAWARTTNDVAFAANLIAMSSASITTPKLVGLEIDLQPASGVTPSTASKGLIINAFNSAIPGAAIFISGVVGGTFNNGIVIDGLSTSAPGLAPNSGATMGSLVNSGTATYNDGAIVLTNTHRLRLSGTASAHAYLYNDSSNNLRAVMGSSGLFVFRDNTDTSTLLSVQSDGSPNIEGAGAYKKGGTQVVGAQGAAVADASGGATIDAEARTAINTLLARLRTHGLIAT